MGGIGISCVCIIGLLSGLSLFVVVVSVYLSACLCVLVVSYGVVGWLAECVSACVLSIIFIYLRFLTSGCLFDFSLINYIPTCLSLYQALYSTFCNSCL